MASSREITFPQKRASAHARAILVTDIPFITEDVDQLRDKIESYFGKTKYGGGDIERVICPVAGSMKNAFVVFESDEVSKRIDRYHVFEEENITVQPLPPVFTHVEVDLDKFYWDLISQEKATIAINHLKTVLGDKNVSESKYSIDTLRGTLDELEAVREYIPTLAGIGSSSASTASSGISRMIAKAVAVDNIPFITKELETLKRCLRKSVDQSGAVKVDDIITCIRGNIQNAIIIFDTNENKNQYVQQSSHPFYGEEDVELEIFSLPEVFEKATAKLNPSYSNLLSRSKLNDVHATLNATNIAINSDTITGTLDNINVAMNIWIDAMGLSIMDNQSITPDVGCNASDVGPGTEYLPKTGTHQIYLPNQTISADINDPASTSERAKTNAGLTDQIPENEKWNTENTIQVDIANPTKDLQVDLESTKPGTLSFYSNPDAEGKSKEESIEKTTTEPKKHSATVNMKRSNRGANANTKEHPENSSHAEKDALRSSSFKDHEAKTDTVIAFKTTDIEKDESMLNGEHSSQADSGDPIRHFQDSLDTDTDAFSRDNTQDDKTEAQVDRDNQMTKMELELPPLNIDVSKKTAETDAYKDQNTELENDSSMLNMEHSAQDTNNGPIEHSREGMESYTEALSRDNSPDGEAKTDVDKICQSTEFTNDSSTLNTENRRTQYPISHSRPGLKKDTESLFRDNPSEDEVQTGVDKDYQCSLSVEHRTQDANTDPIRRSQDDLKTYADALSGNNPLDDEVNTDVGIHYQNEIKGDSAKLNVKQITQDANADLIRNSDVLLETETGARLTDNPPDAEDEADAEEDNQTTPEVFLPAFDVNTTKHSETSLETETDALLRDKQPDGEAKTDLDEDVPHNEMKNDLSTVNVEHRVLNANADSIRNSKVVLETETSALSKDNPPDDENQAHSIQVDIANPTKNLQVDLESTKPGTLSFYSNPDAEGESEEENIRKTTTKAKKHSATVVNMKRSNRGANANTKEHSENSSHTETDALRSSSFKDYEAETDTVIEFKTTDMEKDESMLNGEHSSQADSGDPIRHFQDSLDTDAFVRDNTQDDKTEAQEDKDSQSTKMELELHTLNIDVGKKNAKTDAYKDPNTELENDSSMLNVEHSAQDANTGPIEHVWEGMETYRQALSRDSPDSKAKTDVDQSCQSTEFTNDSSTSNTENRTQYPISHSRPGLKTDTESIFRDNPSEDKVQTGVDKNYHSTEIKVDSCKMNGERSSQDANADSISYSQVVSETEMHILLRDNLPDDECKADADKESRTPTEVAPYLHTLDVIVTKHSKGGLETETYVSDSRPDDEVKTDVAKDYQCTLSVEHRTQYANTDPIRHLDDLKTYADALSGNNPLDDEVNTDVGIHYQNEIKGDSAKLNVEQITQDANADPIRHLDDLKTYADALSGNSPLDDEVNTDVGIHYQNEIKGDSAKLNVEQITQDANADRIRNSDVLLETETGALLTDNPPDDEGEADAEEDNQITPDMFLPEFDVNTTKHSETSLETETEALLRDKQPDGEAKTDLDKNVPHNEMKNDLSTVNVEHRVLNANTDSIRNSEVVLETETGALPRDNPPEDEHQAHAEIDNQTTIELVLPLNVDSKKHTKAGLKTDTGVLDKPTNNEHQADAETDNQTTPEQSLPSLNVYTIKHIKAGLETETDALSRDNQPDNEAKTDVDKDYQSNEIENNLSTLNVEHRALDANTDPIRSSEVDLETSPDDDQAEKQKDNQTTPELVLPTSNVNTIKRSKTDLVTEACSLTVTLSNDNETRVDADQVYQSTETEKESSTLDMEDAAQGDNANRIAIQISHKERGEQIPGIEPKEPEVPGLLNPPTKASNGAQPQQDGRKKQIPGIEHNVSVFSEKKDFQNSHADGSTGAHRENRTCGKTQFEPNTRAVTTLDAPANTYKTDQNEQTHSKNEDNANVVPESKPAVDKALSVIKECVEPKDVNKLSKVATRVPHSELNPSTKHTLNKKDATRPDSAVQSAAEGRKSEVTSDPIKANENTLNIDPTVAKVATQDFISVDALTYTYIKKTSSSKIWEIKKKCNMNIQTPDPQKPTEQVVYFQPKRGGKHVSVKKQSDAKEAFITLYQDVFHKLKRVAVNCEGVPENKAENAKLETETQIGNIAIGRNNNEYILCCEESIMDTALQCFREKADILPARRRLKLKQSNNIDVGTTVQIPKGATDKEQKNRPSVFYTAEGLKLVIIKDDITKQRVDVIVNAANCRLNHGGGVAGAISRAAGSQLQRECKQRMQQRRDISVGHCVETEAYSLPCQYIIHAVGPTYNSKDRYFFRNLTTTFSNVLRMAEKKQSHTIAIPLISSGTSGGPKEMCANALASAIYNLSSSSERKTLQDVFLVNVDQEATSVIHNAFSSLFKPEKESEEPEIQLAEAPRDNLPTVFTTNEGINIVIVKGDITKSSVDVIVNAANGNLLHGGGVAGAIANAAGRRIQEESNQIIAQRQKPLQVGECVVTNGYNLKCKVLHAVGPMFRNCQSEIQFFELLKNTFLQAIRHANIPVEAKSIAIPLISSGIFGGPKDVCAKALAAAVREFSQKERTLVLKRLFLMNIDEEATNYVRAAFQSLFSVDSSVDTNAQDVLPAAAFSSQGENNKIVDEMCMRSNRGITITVLLGDITKQDVDVIVNPTSSTLRHHGVIAKAISDAAGYKLQKHCNYIFKKDRKHAEIKMGETLVTPAFDLRCKNVLHTLEPVHASSSPKQFHQLLSHSFLCCMVFANDTMKVETIAFPLIASSGPPTLVYAEAFVEALTKFDCTVQEVNFTNITLVTNDKSLHGAVQKTLATKFKHSLSHTEFDKHADGANSNSHDTRPVWHGRTADNLTADVTHVVTQQPVRGNVEAEMFPKLNPPNKTTEGSLTILQPTHSSTRSDISEESKPTTKRGRVGSVEKNTSSNRTQECNKCQICKDHTKKVSCLDGCRHTYCTDCIRDFITPASTCQFCGALYGKISEKHLDGTMTYYLRKDESIRGSQTEGVIRMTFNTPSGIQKPGHPRPSLKYNGQMMIAYLPPTTDGYEVLGLLKTAFQSGLLFDIGSSYDKKGRQSDNVVLADIPLKTKTNGGISSDGYPDPNYIKKVKTILNKKGIVQEVNRPPPTGVVESSVSGEV